MTPTEHPTKTPIVATGCFSVLWDVLHTGGIGAPKTTQGPRASSSRVPARRLSLAVLPAVVAFAVLVLCAAPALAARGHVRSSLPAFGGVCSLEPCEGRIKEPRGAAVEEATGDVYVLDAGGNRVVRYSSSGVYLGEFNGSGLLVNGKGEHFEGKAAGSGGLASEEPTGAFNLPLSIAIDNSCAQHKPAPLPEPQCKEVDPSNGDVYVVDSNGRETRGSGGPNNVIDKFTAGGEYVGQITGKSITNPRMIEFLQFKGVAVDPKGSVFASGKHVEVAPGPNGEVEQELEGVDAFSNAQVNSWESWRRTTTTSGGFAKFSNVGSGLAVDSTGDVYARTDPPGYVGRAISEWAFGAGFYLEEISSPVGGPGEPATGVAYGGVATESSTNDVYIDNASSVARFGQASEGSSPEVERFGAGDLPPAPCVQELGIEQSCWGGIAVDSATGQVYVVTSAEQVVQFVLENPAAPRVESESVVRVTDNSVTLQAEVNPRSLAGEAGGEYRFEYGMCSGAPSTCAGSAYGSSTVVGSLSASFDVESVGAPLEGLHAGATYHFRVVASNVHGSVVGGERVFTVRGTGEFVLPDGRQWEMVSPMALHGALIEPLGVGRLVAGGPTRAAVGGGGIAYGTTAPVESQPSGYSGDQQVLSVRGAGGWSSRNVSIPHAVPPGVGEGSLELQLFSEDLSLAVIQPTGSFVPLSGAASEQTAYLRDNSTGAYTPLVTGCPAVPAPCSPVVEGQADVLPGTVFGQQSSEGSCPPKVRGCGPQFVGSTPDLKHVVLRAVAALKPGANGEALYEWNAGRAASEQLQLVSLLPPASPAGKEEPAPGPQLGFYHLGSHSAGAISADGSRVFFTADTHLYMRDTVAHRTIQIDLPAAGCTTCGGGTQGPEFEFATSDGNRVFFADTQKLTADGKEYSTSRSGPVGADLYVCEVREDACVLKDLAPSGEVVGAPVGASEDGSWVYFVANGALAPGAVNGKCENETTSYPPGPTCNLYVVHYEAGVWGSPRLVSVLSNADATDWRSVLPGHAAEASSDGRWLAFMSQRSLTGYDNRDAVSGKPDQEVYLYDVEQNRLTCASCNPSGARPRGVEFGSGANTPLLGEMRVGPQSWLASSIPGWVQIHHQEALYRPRYLSDSGRLLFDSHDALVSKDVNGTGDVYEYEPDGVPVGEHACSQSSVSSSGGSVYRPARPFAVEVEGSRLSGEEASGCVGLISSGSSSDESAFLEASEGGGDVFFLSSERLSPLDIEGGRTVYDAHECTASSPCIAPPAVSPPACTTEASCKAAPSLQPSIFGPSGSATFSGPGNLGGSLPAAVKVKTAGQLRAQKLARALKACQKIGQRAKRARCVKRAQKRYGTRTAGKAKRAGNERRARR